MAYTKTEWKARLGTGLDKFTKSQETENTVVLTSTPDSVTQQGTDLSSENMNHIEDGIEAAHDLIDQEEQERQAEDQNLQSAINAEADARSQGDQAALETAKAYTDEAQLANHAAHEDIRQAVAEEKAAREEADQDLQDQINELAPNGFDDMLERLDNTVNLTGSQTIAGTKTFYASPLVPSKSAAAGNNPTYIATEAQVALKANIADQILTGNVRVTDTGASGSTNHVAVVAATDSINNTILPIGSYIAKYSGPEPPRNINTVIYIDSNNLTNYTTDTSRAGSALSGTWRSCGISGSNGQLFRRVA